MIRDQPPSVLLVQSTRCLLREKHQTLRMQNVEEVLCEKEMPKFSEIRRLKTVAASVIVTWKLEQLLQICGPSLRCRNDITAGHPI